MKEKSGDLAEILIKINKMKTKSKLGKIIQGPLGVIAAIGLIGVLTYDNIKNDSGYSKCIAPWQGLQAEAGVDKWSPYVILRNQSGYISTRQDTSGEFNIIEPNETNSLDDQLKAYTHPDSVPAFKRAWHEVTGRGK